MVEHLTFLEPADELLAFLLQSLEEGCSSGLLASAEDDGVEGFALGEGGEVDLLFFLLGAHRCCLSYIK